MGKVSWKSFASGIIVGSILFSGVSFAAPGVVKLFINGAEIHSAVPAQIIDGSTVVPARALAEALGANVHWDEASRTVTVDTEQYRQNLLKSDDPVSEQQAVDVAGTAQRHFWHMMGGGNGSGLIQSFKPQGLDTDYRWMGSDLNTKVKYMEYLEELFTSEQAAAFWKKLTDSGSILEFDGKLAQPNADGGSMLGWGESKAKIIKDEARQKTFKLTVPVDDQGEEAHDLVLRYVDGAGWRIDQPVDSIR